MKSKIIGVNPLEIAETKYLEEIKKRELKNIIKSYAGYYDAFSELIQNAMDAVDRKKSIINDSEYRKKIWLKINLLENTFSITDNGTGFKKGEINFFAPNISFKKGESRGNKGVGTSFLAYGFNFIQVGTKNKGLNFLVQLKNGNSWLEDEGGEKAPIFEESDLIHEKFNDIEEGTTFTIKFGDSTTRPKKLDWINATTAKQWEQILKLKTPLGELDLKNEIKEDEKIAIEIEVVDLDGNTTTIGNNNETFADYLYPHTVFERCKNYKELLNTRKKLFNQGKDITKIHKDYKKLNGVFVFVDKDELLNNKENLKGLIFKEEDLNSVISEDTGEKLRDFISQFEISVYGFFGYSRQLWEEYNQVILNVRKGIEILAPGIQLATNNMLQGPLLSIPLSFETGYQYQTHVVVHFDGAEPDLGRKGFQPELKLVGEKIAEKLLKMLRRYKNEHLRENKGNKSELLSEESISKWIDKQRAHEINSPLIIKNKNFFLPTKEIGITSTPLSEQDVIVLFSQLIAGGIIRGLKVMSTSQFNQYDGIFKYYYSEPSQNHIFKEDSNPLGIKEKIWQDSFKNFKESPSSTESTTSPKILEYKYNLNSLWEDFNNKEKSEKNINLVISWEIGDKWLGKYTVVSYLDLTNIDDRKIHGVTHSFHDPDTHELKFNAIILSELIDYLNDINSVQEYHKKHYMYL
ncbi:MULTISPECIES: ATP-binding protein [Bacillus]|uniref:Uncharacterized protein n=1 Tax=Bacillus cereus TaxID=1396 RepID=A0A164KVN9_BACCE|nr:MULTISPECIES: ATP-binding protein [Bacillus]KZD51747.1 hypothetical protein B4088_5921 [Bacillus cereus]TSI11203.1 ATP-binding protein [Bacillus sp. HY001]